MESEVFRLKEAAAVMGCHPRTLRRLMARNELPADLITTVTGKPRIKRSALKKYLNSGGEPKQIPPGTVQSLVTAAFASNIMIQRGEPFTLKYLLEFQRLRRIAYQDGITNPDTIEDALIQCAERGRRFISDDVETGVLFWDETIQAHIPQRIQVDVVLRRIDCARPSTYVIDRCA